jgi:hypothetical protein
MPPMIAVFFYGLFMDAKRLQRKGVAAIDQSRARLDGHKLVLGLRATLVPARGSTSYGMLMRLRREDLDLLYSEPGLSDYRPEAVRVVLDDGSSVDALCYNLPLPLADTRPDRAYAGQLYELGVQLGLPADYLAPIGRAASAAEPEI